MFDIMKEKHRSRLILWAYKIKFRREPKDDEFKYWIDFLDSRGTLQDMLSSIADVEISNIQNDNSILENLDIPSDNKTSDSVIKIIVEELTPCNDEAFVDAIYQRLLGRTADIEGRNHHLASLQAHVTRDILIRDMINSPEAAIRKEMLAKRSQQLQLTCGTVTDINSLSIHGRQAYNYLMAAIGKRNTGVV